MADIIGTLEIDGPHEMFLLMNEMLESINHFTICKLFDGSMFILWGEGIQHDKVLLFVADVADVAPYKIRQVNKVILY
jgi:hypothetical protein